MKYINFAGFKDMSDKLSGTVAVFGTGKRARNLIKEHIWGRPAIGRLYAIDITPPASGFFFVDDNAIPVFRPEVLRDETGPVTVLITDNEHLAESVNALKDLHLSDNIRFCIAIFEYMSASVCGEQGPLSPSVISGHSIPHVIHSFWFSGTEMPDLYKRCIESWHKIMPGFEIKIWDTSSYDIAAHPFTLSAFEKKRYAYVSDYARFDVLYKYGGIYLDMDVMIIKPFNDLLSCRSFFGYDVHGNVDPGNGFGTEVYNPLIQKLMQSYDGQVFTDRAIYMQPDFLKPVFWDYGLSCSGDYEEIDGNIFYPRNYFSPYDSIAHIRYADMSRTYSCHLYNSGWLDENQTLKRDKRLSDYSKVIELIPESDYYEASLKALQ